MISSESWIDPGGRVNEEDNLLIFYAVRASGMKKPESGIRIPSDATREQRPIGSETGRW